MSIPHYDWLRLLKVVSISRVCLSQACMYQQILCIMLQENRRRRRSDWHKYNQKPSHWMRYQFHHRLTVRNCVVII